MTLSGGLRGASGESAASGGGGTGVMLRLLGGRPAPPPPPQQHHSSSLGRRPSGADQAASLTAAALNPSSSVSRASGGSSVSRLSGFSAVAARHQLLHNQQQQGALQRHQNGNGRRADPAGQSMQQIVALLEQMAADDRVTEERPWRSMDLPAAGRPSPAGPRGGGGVNPSLDLGRSPVRAVPPARPAASRPPTVPHHSPNTLPLSAVLPGRLLPPMGSSFAMAPARRT